MYKLLFFCVLCFGLCRGLRAQSLTGNPETDRLLDSAKSHVYIDMTMTYSFAVALENAGKAQNNIVAQAYARLYYGVIDESNGDREAALKNYQEAKANALSSGNRIAQLKIMTALSNYYLNISDFAACIKTCHEGIDLATTEHNNEIASQFYNNLSLCHSYMSENDNALRYIDKSIELKKGLNDRTGLANAYLNKGLLLTNMKDYNAGFKYYDKAIAIYLPDSNHISLTQVYINYAWDLTDLGQFSKARSFLTMALAHSQRTGDKIREAGVWNTFGYYYRHAGYPDSVANALHTGYNVSLASGNERNSLEAVKQLSLYYDTIGDSRKALHYLREAWKLNDSIFNGSKIKLTQVLNARFEATQKEAVIAGQKAQIAEHKHLLAQRNMWIVIIISAALVGLVLLYILYHRKQELAQREEEQKMNSAIFESEQKERIRIARDLHDSIGQRLAVMKMALRRSGEDANVKSALGALDETISEVRAISHNLIPETLVLGFVKAVEDLADRINSTENIKATIKVDAGTGDINLPKQTELSLYRIVQEIISNMIRHSRTNEILIDIKAAGGYIQLSIHDYGIGFDTQKMEHSDGLGWKNIFARIKLLNGQIKVQSAKNAGSDFVIHIPI